MRRALLPFILFAVGAASACNSGGSAAVTPALPPIGSPNTVSGVYEAMLKAMSPRGQVLHTKISEAIPSLPETLEREIWVDGASGRGRLESIDGLRVNEADRANALIVDGMIYYQESQQEALDRDAPARSTTKRDASTCHDAPSPVLSWFLSCQGIETSTTTLGTTTEFEGRRVLDLQTEGTSRGSDSPTDFVVHVYIDVETYLAIGSSFSGGPHSQSSNNTATSPSDIRYYKNEYLDIRSLPPDFFDPASIGYTPG